ncbi:MAG: hypoxanthine phosphoribosyltransferase [Clostridia bacterium]|nr:hypoxanthine phosphoribosyltransferase [Clostridia bacterium]
MAKGQTQDFKEILFTPAEISDMVSELGRKITDDFSGKEFVVIGLLKGSVMFMADLLREIKLPCEIDFMAVSSYGKGTETLGRVNILKDISNSVLGKDVLIVEDIVDSGVTLSFIIKHLKNKGAKKVSVCTLLNKTARRKKQVDVQYVGVDVQDEFVAGYGMDYAENYRNIPFIGVLKEEIYQK